MGIEGSKVFVNKGQSSGLKKGVSLAITRKVQTSLVDPDSGQAVVRTKEICILTLDEVEDQLSSGTCKGEEPKAGDLAIEK